MLNNYLVLAWRRLTRNKIVTLINVSGLAIGITAFAVIAWYVQFELSFDRFHSNAASIYRVGVQRYSNGELVEVSARSFPGVRNLLKQTPGVESFTGFYKTPANTGFLFRYKGKIYNQTGGCLNADSAFFSVFPSLLIEGDPGRVLQEPNSIILSESVARSLFGAENPIGQHLDRIDDHGDGSGFIVTGILKDIPENAHFHATVVEQITDNWPESEMELWEPGIGLSTYITLNHQARVESVEEALNRAFKLQVSGMPDLSDARLFLQPMTTIHLSSNLKDELGPNTNKSLVYLIGFVGIIIMIVVWVNCVNIETSRFISQLRQYGIRRIIGSRKRDLMLQSAFEYACVVLIALLLSAIALTYFAPSFTSFLGVSSFAWYKLSLTFWLSLVLVVFGGSIIVSVFPAAFLMRFNPVASLKGNISQSLPRSGTRSVLLLFQFSVAMVLIGFVLVIHRQTSFMRAANKGVELGEVIALRNATAYSDQELSVKHNELIRLQHSLLANASFKHVGSSSAIPGTEVGFSYVNLIKRNMSDPYDPTVYKTVFVNEQFIPAYDIRLVAGKNFTLEETYSGDEPWEQENFRDIILNERAVRQLGFSSPQEAISQHVFFQPFGEFLHCRIIGVIEDYHHEAAKKEVYPSILFNNFGTFQQVYFSVRLNKGVNPRDALSVLEGTWKNVFPDRPFEYFFLDEYYDNQFKSEVRFLTLFNAFAGITVFVSALGVFGASMFEANRRLREISIRRVLGATAYNIVAILSRSNARLTLTATAISCPLLWIISDQWLSRYAMRISFSWQFVVFPLGLFLVVVLIASITNTLRAAMSDPLEHLKEN